MVVINLTGKPLRATTCRSSEPELDVLHGLAPHLAVTAIVNGRKECGSILLGGRQLAVLVVLNEVVRVWRIDSHAFIDSSVVSIAWHCTHDTGQHSLRLTRQRCSAWPDGIGIGLEHD